MTVKTRTGVEVCPKCGSHNVNYLEHDMDVTEYWIYAECEDCNAKFTEVYSIEYLYTETEE